MNLVREGDDVEVVSLSKVPKDGAHSLLCLLTEILGIIYRKPTLLSYVNKFLHLKTLNTALAIQMSLCPLYLLYLISYH